MAFFWSDHPIVSMADSSSSDTDVSMLDSNGQTLLHALASLPGNKDLFASVLAMAPKSAKIPDNNSNRPMHLLSVNDPSFEDKFTSLYRAYPDVATIPNNDGDTPFHMVADGFDNLFEGCDDLMETIFRDHPEAIFVPNKKGATPLSIASRFFFGEAMQEIMHKIAPRVLHAAIEHPSEIYTSLLKCMFLARPHMGMTLDELQRVLDTITTKNECTELIASHFQAVKAVYALFESIRDVPLKMLNEDYTDLVYHVATPDHIMTIGFRSCQIGPDFWAHVKQVAKNDPSPDEKYESILTAMFFMASWLTISEMDSLAKAALQPSAHVSLWRAVFGEDVLYNWLMKMGFHSKVCYSANQRVRVNNVNAGRVLWRTLLALNPVFTKIPRVERNAIVVGAMDDPFSCEDLCVDTTHDLVVIISRLNKGNFHLEFGMCIKMIEAIVHNASYKSMTYPGTLFSVLSQMRKWCRVPRSDRRYMPDSDKAELVDDAEYFKTWLTLNAPDRNMDHGTPPKRSPYMSGVAKEFERMFPLGTLEDTTLLELFDQEHVGKPRRGHPSSFYDVPNAASQPR